MNRYAVGDNIARHLARKGWTQRRLAEEIGITEVTMSRYTCGTRQPTVYALYRMSHALGCTMEDLCYGIDSEVYNE